MNRIRRTDCKQHPRGPADIKNKAPQFDFRIMHVQVGGRGVYDTEYAAMGISTPPHPWGSAISSGLPPGVDRILRLVCSLRSAPPFSSESGRGLNQTPAKGRKSASERFSSA
jgi:hypothetical protein